MSSLRLTNRALQLFATSLLVTTVPVVMAADAGAAAFARQGKEYRFTASPGGSQHGYCHGDGRTAVVE